MLSREMPAVPPKLRICLLGGFRVIAGARVVDEASWRRQKPKSLLKLLALAPNHAMHREHVFDELWPELELEAAANNLHQTIHLVRRALDPTGVERVILVKNEILSLQPLGGVWIDVDEFEEAAANARRTRALDDYRAAVDLYTGDLLPEDRYEDWAASRRDALRETYLTLLIELASLSEVGGDVAGAIAALKSALDNDRSREPVHRELMRLYALSGDRQQALRQYQRLEESLHKELDAGPDAQSRELREQIASGFHASAEPFTKVSISTSVPLVRNNLPAQPTSFVGRAREIAEVTQLLSSTRLLTLIGPGGVGKTRLALEIGCGVNDVYSEGVWLIEFGALADPDLIPHAIAATLGVRISPDRLPIDTLERALAQRQLLLVFDNCEHLIESCAIVANALLRAAPDLSILATSREPLRVPGEVTWPVPSLSLPAADTASADAATVNSDAVTLFVSRAQEVRPGFEASEGDIRDLVHLCHRLDGLPLAIELAAALVSVLSVREIADRLDDRFALLGGGSRFVPTRQQTLRAALEWSYELLEDVERVLFSRLSIFSGSFSLAAAEAVCAGDGIERRDVLFVVRNLVDKSLVVAEHHAAQTRYRMLETIREYARDHLNVGDAGNSIRKRHAAHFLDFAEEAGPRLRGNKQREWLIRLELDHDNFRTALGWSQATNGDQALRLASALSWFWLLSSRLSEGRDWLKKTLATAEIDHLNRARVKALTDLGVIAQAQDDTAEGRADLEASVAHWRELGDREQLAYALAWLSWSTLFDGDLAGARARAAESLDIATSLQEQWTVALATQALGFIACETGDLAEARAHGNESHRIYRELGDRWGAGGALADLARISYLEGDFQAAQSEAEACLANQTVAADKWQMVQTTGLLTEIARANGDVATARAYGQRSLAMAEQLGQLGIIGWSHRSLGYIETSVGDFEAARSHFETGLDVFRERGYKLGIACCIAGLAGLAVAQGDYRRAVRRFGAANALLDTLGATLAPADRLAIEASLAAARDHLTGEEFASAWVEGKAKNLDQAIAEALTTSAAK
jgi:predicted ATPase/DNA-binding SARP family transcriptional activator